MDFDFNKILDSITKFFEYVTSGAILKDFILLSLNSIITLIIFVFGWLPSLPNFPNDVLNQLYTFFDYPFTSGVMGFIGWIFGGWAVLRFVFWGSFAVYLFRISYDFTVHILTKIPVIGVKK